MKNFFLSFIHRLTGTSSLQLQCQNIEANLDINNTLKKQNRLLGDVLTFLNEPKNANCNNEPELNICRKIAPQAIFIFGYARSSTTIIAQLVNASREALILTEANFFLEKSEVRFCDDYNEQHVSFGNQISKSTYTNR